MYDIFLAHEDLHYLLRLIDKDMDYISCINRSSFIFKKDNKKTEQIVEFLKRYDSRCVFYFNEYLEDCIKKQKLIERNVETLPKKAWNTNGIISPEANRRVNKLNFLESLQTP